MVKLLQEHPNIKGIIFDLDGTLLDSMQLWQDIDKEYLESHGKVFHPSLSEKIKTMSFFESATFFRHTLGIDKEETEIMQDWKDMASLKYATSIPLKPGVFEFLKAMKANDIPMVIVTSCVKEHALSALKRLEIESYFKEIYFALELQLNKNEPAIFYKCIDTMQIQPKECIVFEDLYSVLDMVQKEGFMTCGIYDVLSKDQVPLFKKYCDYYIEDFNELL